MMTLTIPPSVLRVLYELEKRGYPAYIVGGSLRDALMDKTPHDWDVTTAARPDRMLEIFGAAGLTTIPTGLQHGTVTVLVDREPIECTTYRLDGEYTDARHPDRVEFTDRISDDLARRDFTVNAMACRLPALSELTVPPIEPMTVTEDDVEPVDLFGGREDLDRHIIRCVGEPEKRFDEDALRMLRAIRFCVQLGFAVDDATVAALAKKREGLSLISAERIASELTRTLACPCPSRGLALMRQTGLWDFVLPELCPSENPYFTSETELFDAVDSLPEDAMLRLALLLSNGDADTARVACRQFKLSNKQTDAVAAYVRALRGAAPASEAAVRRFLAEYGEYADGALLLCRTCADESALYLYDKAAEHVAAIRARGDCLCLADLAVDGKALMAELGVRGPDVGRTLHALLDAVLDDPSLNERERLLAFVRQKTE